MKDLRQEFTIRIATPPYTPISGGVRALFLLCHNLNEAGFRAVVSPGGKAPAHLDAPTGAIDALNTDDRAIAVYPETIGGNPWSAQHVVRFLLNKPGVANVDQSARYGPNDYFVTFDKSHVPAGRSSIDLFVPLVDRRHYFTPPDNADRHGFVVCSKNKPAVPLVVPQWASPLTLALPHRGRTHEQLGQIYRSSRALIAYERSTAIYEALACGCPVLCIESDVFNRRTYQPRFGGAGLCWDFDEVALERAAASVDQFAATYGAIEAEFPRRVEQAFTAILRAVATGAPLDVGVPA